MAYPKIRHSLKADVPYDTEQVQPVPDSIPNLPPLQQLTAPSKQLAVKHKTGDQRVCQKNVLF